jgi:hypothetical protein
MFATRPADRAAFRVTSTPATSFAAALARAARWIRSCSIDDRRDRVGIPYNQEEIVEMSPRAASVVISVLIVVASASAAQVAQPRPPSLPDSVHIDPQLRPTADMLLARSPTFQRQCARIAQVRALRIDVRLVPRLFATSARARASAARYEFGRLVVTIDILAGGEYAELLAHEFEHVTEQIERVDLAALARTDPRSASALGDGTFETMRAREAGRAAAREVHGEIDPAVAAVGSGLKRAARSAWKRLGRVEAVAPDPRLFRRN